MKRRFILLTVCCLTYTIASGQSIERIHENERITPYPQQGHTLYVNPAPLLVPQDPATANDLLQFNLSQDPHFKEESSLLSKPAPWRMFNPHCLLQPGVWYWRVRSISPTGQVEPWSRTYSFTMSHDVPQFATPAAEVFLNNIPTAHPRIYCFLNDSLPQARKEMRSHPEFEAMIDDARDALAISYKTESKPYSKITQMAASCDKLNTAFQLLQYDLYANKMVENVRYLLATKVDESVINNDFKAGELAYTLACTYDNCLNLFTRQEQQQIEEILLNILSRYYTGRILGHEETHIFDNHFWQFTFRHLMQAAIVIYDKYSLAKEYLEYSYELWTARAPASGFNRDGAWHNGTNYFSANAVSLCYVPTLFSYLTGFDFLQHPWYKNAGLAMTYSWLPEARSNGFGDGHEKNNGKPLRIRSAFADFLARTTGDPYATWYSSTNHRYTTESETRLYRMASGKKRPLSTQLPIDAPKAVWFKDCGEMIANSNLNDLTHNLSLSFHSSPFGSGSHTHSCQNAFNLQYGGKAVYYAVGHYMNFSDPHNLLSYRHTRAYNTLLIDGIGQPFTTRAYGNITRMLNGKHITYALGDASNAYCGISEYPMWQSNFAAHQLEQSHENGFGETPLTKYHRHIFLLDPNIVVIFDELEAKKKVCWDWLLHSPVKFDIDRKTNTLVTCDKSNGIHSVAQLFSLQPCVITQTDQYAAAPNEQRAERGENFEKPWSLTAQFGPSKTNRILTIIQVETDQQQIVPVNQLDNGRFQCGNWIIEAGLNTKSAANLLIRNDSAGTIFSYGNKQILIDGSIYRPDNPQASILYDQMDGEWKTVEMNNSNELSTGTLK